MVVEGSELSGLLHLVEDLRKANDAQVGAYGFTEYTAALENYAEMQESAMLVYLMV